MPVEEAVERALVVMAHPDDADFGCAGTVALWTRAGTAITYLLVTDGEAGGDDRTLDTAAMAGLRHSEQRGAAEAAGVRDVRFLGHPDGRVTASLELRRDIARVIRQVRPERMVIPSPDRDWRRIHPSHPDHLAVGEAAICAVFPDARNPHAHPELLRDEGPAPWTVPEVWLTGGPEPDRFPDVTEVFEQKMAALAAHASQIPDPAALESRGRERLSSVAAGAGLPEGRLAGAFRYVDTR
ncbi:PIG-L deacetylase family protein [Nocardiopsis composta]|uniref:LmbE family N-acetylglucosaminyl deacetylase n=1 Tax=Nocardiopsis composta TaxID=157465 RepID=A0A7W8QS42_9ACTN|nr:PIG-L deacetylase family protein [Nocardiopsis composta]MBB5435451.1 LmbE family N-acetylglucosaminyl deacetylase [Nocardiopsis composta]